MSRGLGYKQLMILEALENSDYVILDKLISIDERNYNHTDYEAKYKSELEGFRRAARTLIDRGLIIKIRIDKVHHTLKQIRSYITAYKRC